MIDNLTVARSILQKFLSAGPLKGARLKPLFVAEFERQTGDSFARAFWNYPKFSEVLRAMPDLVELIPPQGPGDITVRLWVTPTTLSQDPASTGVSVSAPLKYIPSPLWHAFTNPDPKRRRFYHRKTSEVIHYVEGDISNFTKLLAAKVSADPNYVEITPISPADQSTWMQEFLTAQSLPERTRSALNGITQVPYSSQINKAFSAAVGERAGDWRSFRIAKVHARVQKWADASGVVLPSGTSLPELTPAPSIEASPPQSQDTVSSLPLDHGTKRFLHAVVDALEPHEVANVLIPASVLFRIAAARQ